MTQADERLPKTVDLAIIGGGLIGITTALFLAERGVSVIVCEKGRIGGEQSTRNWGWCRKMGRDPVEIPLAVASAGLWEGMNDRVGAETGFRRTGIFYLCKSENEIAKYHDWLRHDAAKQLDSVILSSSAISEKLPALTGRWQGALYTRSDGRAEPSLATAAIAAAAAAKGVAIRERCAVRGIERSAGRLSGIVTEQGPIRCSHAIVAGGAWTRLFLGNLGVEFPQLKVIGSVLRTAPLEGAPEQAVAGTDFAFRKRLDGGYTIAQKNANIAPIVPDSFRLFFRFLPAFRSEGNQIRVRFGRPFFDELRQSKQWNLDESSPFEKQRVLNPKPSSRVLEEGLRNLRKSFPGFAKARIAESWGCAIDVTPDAIPVIDAIADVEGLFVASGFSGHGFGVGPAAGHLMADLITGQAPIVDPAPYRFDRLVAAR